VDRLHIKDLKVATHIGVYAWEQQILQHLLINIIIPADFSACEDELVNTLDYDKLCQQVSHYVKTNTFRLIETVAEKVAQFIKSEFHIQQVTVSINKPHAIKNAAGVEVTVTR
jgi:7,8-dihydroneopterin aldolase/epimerase/oxygenase